MKLRITILFGGVSVEHEISILSALQAMAAMNEETYEIIPVYIAKNGNFYTHQSLRDIDTFRNLDTIENTLSPVCMMTRNQQHFLVPTTHHIRKKEIPFDLAFPILHGTNGEDGSIQGYLSTMQIPYVGCSVLAGALGQDKAMMKMVLQNRDIPVVPWFYWLSSQPLDQTFFTRANRLHYPLIVKPANLGSSIGIQIVHDEQTLTEAMEDAFQYDEKVVIERAIVNLREVNCAVMGNHIQAQASVIEEVLKQDDILSYADKYGTASSTKGMMGTSRIIPALLSDDMSLLIQRYALQTFKELSACGVARIDFIIDQKNDEIYVNEINTIPGSLSCYLWQHSGIAFTSMLDQLIEGCIEDYRRSRRFINTYDTNILSHYGDGSKGVKK